MNNAITELIERAKKVSYYKALWGNNTFETLQQYPLSSKQLFSPQTSAEVLARSTAILSCYFSAGTTGKPKVIPFSETELEERSQYRGTCYSIAGISNTSRVAILLPFGPWVAGPSAQHALLSIGCTVFPIGLLSSDEELDGLSKTLTKHKITTLISTPSLIQRLLFLQETQGASRINVEKIITSGEYVPEKLREDVARIWSAELFSSYATSESFIGIECGLHNGFHYDPEHVLIETIDPTSGKETSETGIIVITAPHSYAIPIIRYPLDDLGVLTTAPCSCGSSLPRILLKGRVHGRIELAGGVSFSTYQIAEALAQQHVPYTKCDITVLEKTPGRDALEIVVHVIGETDSERIHTVLENSSLDFKDVILHELVSLTVVVINDTSENQGAKAPIRIHDKRHATR